MSNWLKGTRGTESAKEEMKDPEKPTTVWLYRLADGTLVGFGALAKSAWSWTQRKDPWIPVTVITWCGIQKDLQGQPLKSEGTRYSHQIMDDLINEAMQDHVTHPVLGLMVDVKNIKAISLYKKFKFIDNIPTWTDSHGVTYQNMGVILNQESFNRLHGTRKKTKR